MKTVQQYLLERRAHHGVPTPEVPICPDDGDELRSRARFVLGAAVQTLEALYGNVGEIPIAKSLIWNVIRGQSFKIDETKLAYALAAVSHAAEEMRLTCGVNGAPIDEIIHRCREETDEAVKLAAIAKELQRQTTDGNGIRLDCCTCHHPIEHHLGRTGRCRSVPGCECEAYPNAPPT